MRRLLPALLGLALAAAPASPYQLQPGSPKWPPAKATLHYDAGTISGAYVTEFGSALKVWSNVTGSIFSFTNGGRSASANVKDSTNGTTDVYFDNLPPFGYAVTYVQTSGGAIVEADVAFNNNMTWTTTGDGRSPDFQTVAIHEFGHVLGLGHSNVRTAIMYTGDPTKPHRYLDKDDAAGVVALYPGSGPGPGPGPGPSGPDLLVDSVTFGPAGAGPGDAVTITYTMRNTGTVDAAPFAVNAYLTGSLRPSPEDLFLGSDPRPRSLGAGKAATGRFSATLGRNLLPGEWKVGVILDPTGSTGDRNLANNGGASLGTVTIERPPLPIGPGDRVEAELGPRGRDTFTLDLFAGTRLTLKGSIDRGALALTLGGPGAGTPLAFSRDGRKAKLRATVPEDGTYTLLLESRFAGIAGYSLAARAGRTKHAGAVPVEGVTRIPIPAYGGSSVKVTLRMRDGLRASVEVDGAAAEVRPNRAGTRVRARFVAPATGRLDLLVAPAGGTTGSVSWKARVKPPKKRTAIRR